MILALLIIWFVAYWGGMAALIWFDARRQRIKAIAERGVDFADRSPWQYMILGVFCGPLPIVFYFGISRKSALGWLMGIAIGATWSVLFSVLFNLLVHPPVR
jgi:hypothetical protein